MYCQNCGKEIPDDSTFCGFCGAQIGAASQKQSAKPNTKNVSIQNNENIQKAQESLKSGWNAVVAVLKDPEKTVNLGIGEMVVIGVISVIAHTIFMLLIVSGFHALFSSLFFGGYSSYSVSIAPSVLWSILTGIFMTICLVGINVLSHCVEDKGFAKVMHYLPGAFISCILPSVAVIAAGLCSFISEWLFVFFLVLALVAYLTCLLKSFGKTNQYIVMLFVTVAIMLLAFVLLRTFMHALGDSLLSLYNSSLY